MAMGGIRMQRNWKKNLTGLLILSQLGSGVLAFILSWYVLQVTNSALSFSQVVVPTSIVGLIAAYPIGKIIDKYAKNRLMLLGQLASILSLAVFALFHYIHGEAYLTISIVVLTVCLAICDELVSSVLFAAAKQIVNSEEELGTYNSLSQTIRGICSMVAPLLGGALYKLLSVQAFVLIEIVIESICVIYIYRIKLVNEVQTKDTEAEQEPDLSIKDMFKYLTNNKILLHLNNCMFLLNLFLGVFNVRLPFILSTNFNDKPFIFGMVNFIFPVGMLTASILYQTLQPGGNLLKQTIYTWTVPCFIITLLGVSTYILNLKSYLFAFILLLLVFIAGFGMSFGQIPQLTYWQKKIPEHIQGRFFAMSDSIVKAAIPVSYLLYGVLFDHFNLSAIFIVSGLLGLAYMLFMFIYVNMLEEERG